MLRAELASPSMMHALEDVTIVAGIDAYNTRVPAAAPHSKWLVVIM